MDNRLIDDISTCINFMQIDELNMTENVTCMRSGCFDCITYANVMKVKTMDEQSVCTTKQSIKQNTHTDGRTLGDMCSLYVTVR